jgi:hypothetical protein
VTSHNAYLAEERRSQADSSSVVALHGLGVGLLAAAAKREWVMIDCGWHVVNELVVGMARLWVARWGVDLNLDIHPEYVPGHDHAGPAPKVGIARTPSFVYLVS